MTTEVLQQALEALEEAEYARTDLSETLVSSAIIVLREALVQPAQPVHLITADDVTDEMRNAFRDGDDDSAFENINKCLAAAVNAWIKHRGDTK